ncbi:MAG: lysozyme inhibitor LprI family protein [Phormidesmis sp.]
MTQNSLCVALSLLLGLVACTSVDDLPASELSGEETEQAALKPADDNKVSKPQSSEDSIETQLEEVIAADSLNTPGTASQPNTSQPDAIGQPDEAAPLRLESDCQAATTQVDLNQCAQQEYDIADAQLNRAYRSLKIGLSDSAAQALTTAELAWIAFRDLDCTFVSDQYEGGSIAPLIHSNCLSERTLTRTDEIGKPELPASSYQAADKRLNERYQALLGRLSGSQKQEIADVQLAWIEYRDRNCAFEVLYSTNVIEETQCLARMSETRAAELQAIVEQRSL